MNQEPQSPKCDHHWHYWVIVYTKMRECYTCKLVQQMIDKIWVSIEKDKEWQ